MTQTVKEVVQSLVDDNMVELEKVGTQNIFWSFPSKTYRQVRPLFLQDVFFQNSNGILACCVVMRQLQTKAESLKSQIEEDQKTIEHLKSQIKEQSKGKEESVCDEHKFASCCVLLMVFIKNRLCFSGRTVPAVKGI